MVTAPAELMWVESAGCPVPEVLHEWTADLPDGVLIIWQLGDGWMAAASVRGVDSEVVDATDEQAAKDAAWTLYREMTTH